MGKHSEAAAKRNQSLTAEQIRAAKCQRSKARNEARRAEFRKNAKKIKARAWELHTKSIPIHKQAAKVVKGLTEVESRIVLRPSGSFDIKVRPAA